MYIRKKRTINYDQTDKKITTRERERERTENNEHFDKFNKKVIKLTSLIWKPEQYLPFQITSSNKKEKKQIVNETKNKQ